MSTITWTLQIDWDRDGTFTDESSRLVSASGSMRVVRPGDTLAGGLGIVDRAVLILDNYDGRYSPLNTSSHLYSAIQNGGAYQVPVLLSVTSNGSTARVFLGTAKIPTEVGATSKRHPTVRLDCRSRADTILQKRASTTLASFVGYYDNGASEEEIIRDWLKAAGLTDGTDFVSQSYAMANPTYTATLDPGMFVIPWAWLDEESVLEDVWKLAAACGGLFYFSPDDVSTAPSSPKGSFRYVNMGAWALETTYTEALGKGDFKALTPRYEDRDLYNAVTVEVSPRDIYDTDTIWEADTVISVSPSSTQTVTAQLGKPAYSISSVTFTAITAGGKDISSDVSVSYTAYAQRLELSITNSNSTQSANLVSLTVTGKPVVGSRNIEVKKESSDSFWSGRVGRSRFFRNNEYVQTEGQGNALAEFMRDRHETPTLSYVVAGVFPGRPQRRLGDRIQITDADVMTTAREAYITGIDWRLGRGGFEQDYHCVDAEGLYPYLKPFDTYGYFVIGTNKLGNTTTSSVPGRVFY